MLIGKFTNPLLLIKMPRHARNCTAGSVYTYHERMKDSLESGYGSTKIRLGKDSIKEFDCCCLSLQPCAHPVVTIDGYLYDKENVLKYIISRKNAIRKQMREFGKQALNMQREKEEEKRVEKAELIEKFFNQTSVVKKNTQTDKDTKTVLPSFWIPSLTPHSKPTRVKKPDEKVRCPMSGQPLKFKDLIEVKFTPIQDGKSGSVISKTNRYVCPVTNDILGNSVPCAVLRTSGSVVTMECVEKIIRKDMLDPINGDKLREKDIIMLKRGATGFAGSGINLEAEKYGAVMTA